MYVSVSVRHFKVGISEAAESNVSISMDIHAALTISDDNAPIHTYKNFTHNTKAL